MQDKPLRDAHDSDFLPWILAAVAVVIMAFAVHLNAKEPAASRPEELQQADHSPTPPPGRVWTPAIH